MSLTSRRIDIRDGWADIRVHATGEGQDLLFLCGASGILPDDPFLTALGAHYRVHAPLLPGFEDSEGGEGLETMLDFALHAFDVSAALGLQRPVVVGHSLGGMIAAEMAAIAPHDVEHLVLIDPLGLWSEDHPVPDLFATLPFELPGLLLHDPERHGDLVSAGGDLDDPAFLTTFLVDQARRLGTAGKLLFPIPDRGLAERLYRIRAHTLVVWGESDRFVDPAYGARFRDGIAGAALELVPEAGHMAPYEQTARVVSLIREFVGAR